MNQINSNIIFSTNLSKLKDYVYQFRQYLFENGKKYQIKIQFSIQDENNDIIHSNIAYLIYEHQVNIFFFELI